MSELTIAKAATLYKISYSTIYNWIQKGLLPSKLAPGKGHGLRVFEKNDFEIMLQNRRIPIEPIVKEQPEHPKSEFGKQMFQRMEKLEETILILSGQQAEMINVLKNLSSKVPSDVTLNSGLNGLESKIEEWLNNSENELHYEKRISEMEGRETVLDRIIKDLLQKNPNLWK